MCLYLCITILVNNSYRKFLMQEVSMLQPTEKEIRDELDRILESRYFQKSVILSRFLSFVVNKNLEGKSNEIKEYSVGVEVLGRRPGYNPQTDAAVRVHAVRLRKTLQEYYNNEGNESGLEIILPKGSYQPVYQIRDLPRNGKVQADKTAGIKQPSNMQPFEAICVLPFKTFSSDPKGSDFIVDGFCSQLSDALSLFQDIAVISYTSTANFLREGGDIATIGEQFNATYLLTGSVQIFEHDIQVEVELLDASDNLLLWSHVYNKHTNGDSLIEIIRSISEHIISMLVGYNGYVHLHKYAVRDISSLSPSSVTTAIFWYYHYRTRNTKEVFTEAVKRLELAVKEDSQSALAWAVLGHLYADVIFNFYPTTVDPLGNAIRCTEKALSINPECQHALLVKALISVIQRDKENVALYLQKCYKVNPNDPYFLAAISLGYTIIGDYKKSLSLLHKAVLLNPIQTWTLYFPEIADCLLNANYDKAYFFASRIKSSAGIFQHIFEIITLYYLNQTEKFTETVKLYKAKFPDGLAHVAKAMGAFFLDQALQDIIQPALAAAATVPD